jgi:hypothetical protein
MHNPTMRIAGSDIQCAPATSRFALTDFQRAHELLAAFDALDADFTMITFDWRLLVGLDDVELVIRDPLEAVTGSP